MAKHNNVTLYAVWSHTHTGATVENAGTCTTCGVTYKTMSVSINTLFEYQLPSIL